MGKCSICKKKLGFWEGFSDSEGEYCDKCFKKRKKDSENFLDKNEEKQKNSDKLTLIEKLLYCPLASILIVVCIIVVYFIQDNLIRGTAFAVIGLSMFYIHMKSLDKEISLGEKNEKEKKS